MKFIADFHIHSHYSRATSKLLIPEFLDYWAKLKGINIVGSGDFTHPGWLKELQTKLEPAEPGLYKLKKEYKNDQYPLITPPISNPVRFLLTAEISTIYKKMDKVRKVHHLIFAPNFEVVEQIQQELTKIGANITSDGRPILGLDSRNLLEIILNVSDKTFLVPAHIWTPWFSVLGAKSGFDFIKDCYGDLSGHIQAVETGLSSDPPLNWICSRLDQYTLISNSDAHSPEKLGREANILNSEFNYPDIIQTIKKGKNDSLIGTIEFFPQEGKYHFDGHRKCGICWHPFETLKNQEVCPECGKKVTVGVMNRVMQLADREKPIIQNNQPTFYSLIPLKEILSEILGAGTQSKIVTRAYFSLIEKLGSEFDILLNLPPEEIKNSASFDLSEAIKRMRKGEIYIKEGFDGEFGRITVFSDRNKNSSLFQKSLFQSMISEKSISEHSPISLGKDLKKFKKLEKKTYIPRKDKNQTKNCPGEYLHPKVFENLNSEQKEAVEHFKGPALIIAGPGTGKTRVLAYRIAHLIELKKINPSTMLAVTFTNKAADEIKERVEMLLPNRSVSSKLQVSTFHAFGYSLLKKNSEKTGRDNNFSIIDERDKSEILSKIVDGKEKLKKTASKIRDIKMNLKSLDEVKEKNLREIYLKYNDLLKRLNVFDLDDLITVPVQLFDNFPELLSRYQSIFQWVMVDEYQDINFAQYKLIKNLMPAKTSNLVVIGDPNQAIYGFRGASAEFINRFVIDHPDGAIYNLKQTYRCSNHILRASENVIKPVKVHETSLNAIYEGVKINIVQNNTEKSEAEFVARTIENMMGGLRFFSMDSQISEGEKDTNIESLSDFVVLCRINRQIETLEKAFSDHNIPYQTLRDVPFFKKEPVRYIIDLLNMIYNPKNSFIKDKMIKKYNLNPFQVSEIETLLSRNPTITDIISFIINRFFEKQKSKSGSLLEKLLNLSKSYNKNMEKFLKFTALGTETDMYGPELEQVTLMTLHASKGLEFTCVFIIGCENGLIPYTILKGEEPDLNEERRLLYVGMTRAKKYLFLSSAKKRSMFGTDYHFPRSPFVEDIEKKLLKISESKYKIKKTNKGIQLKLFDS